jgi:hypothetical protein
MPTLTCCSAERSGAAGGGSGGHDRMKQTTEAAAAPASLGVAQDAAVPGAAGPPDADGQQALHQYLVNLCQPAALVSSKRQRRVVTNVNQSCRSSHRRWLWCRLLSLASPQAQCSPAAGFVSATSQMLDAATRHRSARGSLHRRRISESRRRRPACSSIAR